jgi:hypothetical protein
MTDGSLRERGATNGWMCEDWNWNAVLCKCWVAMVIRLALD